MNKTIKLNSKNLNAVSPPVQLPRYNRQEVRAGMVHIGIGGFHRAHQAYYMDRLLTQGLAGNWGICGVALLESDRKIYEVLSEQDGLYTLMTPDSEGNLSAQVIGSIIEVLFAPEDPDAVIKKIADPRIHLVTLTITEGGYNFAPDGSFNWENESVLWDLQHPDHPRTVFGYLYAALKIRYARGLGGLTIQSCDNIEHNGDVIRRMLSAFIEKVDPGMLEWVETQLAFPNSMVDRITPVTTPAIIDTLEKEFGLQDAWPVISESYIQWIIEDAYASGRPEWERAEVQMVADVTPYEKMKIRLLNGSHTLVGLMGDLLGYTYIHESMGDPLVSALMRVYMDQEAGPTLDPVPGVDLDTYKSSLLERFRNPLIKDGVARIISGSSDKFPKFILPVVSERLNDGQSIRIAALVVAAWYVYLSKHLSDKKAIQDGQADLLIKTVREAEKKQNPGLFLKQAPIFGPLGAALDFEEIFVSHVSALKESGARPRMEAELSHIHKLSN